MARGAQSTRSDATRALIVDTALAAFAQNGYTGTSIREIASRAGITHPTLLYHFPSKPGLLTAVLNRRDEIDCDERDGGVPFSQLAGHDMLAHLIRGAARNEANRGLVELFAQLSAEASSPDHPAHDYFQDRYASLKRKLTRALGELRDQGSLRQGVDPAVYAALIVATMDGLQVQWLLDPHVDMAAGLAAFINDAVLVPSARIEARD